jgi:signal transduction histidine kinase
MTQSGYLLLGLTAIVAALAGVLAFAVARIFSAARQTTKDLRKDGAETEFMAAAMEQAMGQLREQERAMKARAEASERLSGEIIASMTSGLLVVGHDGGVRTINPAGRRLLGLDARERSGASGAALAERSELGGVHPSTAARGALSEVEGPGSPPSNHDWTGGFRDLLAGALPLADVIDESLAGGRAVVRRTIQMQTPTGASHLGVTVSPIRDDSGSAHGAICLFSDLSDVVELEEQLRLKDSLARLGELTAGIAHEFRNGLATIHGYSRLFEMDRLPSDFHPYVQGIKEETEALGEVVTNFLNFAKPAELTLAPVDMRTIVERAAEEISGEARARGGTVSVQGTFGVVSGDDVLLRQAFSNLCRNALEACTDARIAPRIVIDGAREDAHLRITVTDNGPGIAPGVAARIFRPFVTTKPRGIGLGLALVQKIVVTHNGRVTATAGDNGGARFTVTLPLA